MIVEGVLTTLNDDGTANIAAMGATLTPDDIRPDGLWISFQLKPFESSRTFHNLKMRQHGVFHLLDDAETLARAALSEAENARIEKAGSINGYYLADAVRAYEFQLEKADWSRPRATLNAKVLKTRYLREWSGWNRAQHAVLELTIMATRVAWTPRQEIESQITQLQPLIDKTAGEREQMGWSYVIDYLNRQWAKGAPAEPLKK